MKLLEIQNSTHWVNNLDKKVPDVTTLIHVNQYNTDKQNLEKKIRDVDKKNTRYK